MKVTQQVSGRADNQEHLSRLSSRPGCPRKRLCCPYKPKHQIQVGEARSSFSWCSCNGKGLGLGVQVIKTLLGEFWPVCFLLQMSCPPFVSLCCAEEYAGDQDVSYCSGHHSTQGGVLCLGPNPVPVPSAPPASNTPQQPRLSSPWEHSGRRTTTYEFLICLETVWKECF